ncbi:uncharacterized protein [Dermacentor andersoni]|uniref:uncharacterized protein n=1 Tax=Dermacentor andersoni TaxID=34620 RepID=UPI0021554B37|nr:uncharacterized protein LOC126539233 [Dermacentor andersoni]
MDHDYTPLLDIKKEHESPPPLNIKRELGSGTVNGDHVVHAASEQADGAKKPKKHKASSSVRCDPTVMELCEILADPARLEAFLCEYGLGITPPPPPSAALLTHPRRIGRPCTASQVWGICSVLKFNPLLPDCKGRITTCVRKGVKDGRPAYRCSYCRKQISQLNGPTPWAQKSAASPASFFCQVDCRGRPNVRLSKCEILWIVYCMAKDLTAAKTTELGYAVRTPTISYWRQRVRQVVSRSLSGHPRMGGSSERVQVGVFKLKFKSSSSDDPILILGLLAESTGEFRLLHIGNDEPDCIAQIVTKAVLPETKIISTGGKVFNHIEAAEDEDGPMRLVHDDGSQNDGATTKSGSKRQNSFCNTQKILCLWRRVRSKLMLLSCSKDPTALQGHLDWFWWLSMNGVGHCKDPFLRLLESIVKAYDE